MAKGSTFDFSVSTILGAKKKIFTKLENQFSIEPRYCVKWRKSKLIGSVISLLSMVDAFRWNRLQANRTFDKPPIFILGHWRSGTTYLHNLLCIDKEAGYPTTFQTVFPNNLFAFQRILKFSMNIFLPDKRPGDGLPLRVDQPQEEEFAIGNEIDYSFYYWMYFPKDAPYFRDIHFSSDKIPEGREQQWKDNYQRFVKRSLLNTKGEVFISKNPPNTARIKWILDLYPDAKFVFMHRNPYEVFRSTKKFFSGVIPPLQFQDIHTSLFDEHVLESYIALHKAYFEQRDLIPKKNLIEVAYEDLIVDPYQVIYKLAEQFSFPALSRIKDGLQTKIEESKGHQIDNYHLDATTIKKINVRWSLFFTRFGYSVKE